MRTNEPIRLPRLGFSGGPVFPGVASSFRFGFMEETGAGGCSVAGAGAEGGFRVRPFVTGGGGWWLGRLGTVPFLSSTPLWSPGRTAIEKGAAVSLVGVIGSAGSLAEPTLSPSSGMAEWHSTAREFLRTRWSSGAGSTRESLGSAAEFGAIVSTAVGIVVLWVVVKYLSGGCGARRRGSGPRRGYGRAVRRAA